MTFFLCFLCSQLLRAETQDSEGVPMSVLNALTGMKNTSRSISEEYQRKPRCFDRVLEGSGEGLPGLKPIAPDRGDLPQTSDQQRGG